MLKARRNRKLALALVLLPLIVASLAMMWGNSRMLDGISTSVDRLDEQRNWQAIQSAFNNEVHRISSVLSDNAKWDDAADHSYENLDETWALDTWGFSTADANYDTMFIVDEAGKGVIGFQHGKRTTIQPREFYGSTFTKILMELPRDTSSFAIANSMIKTQIGIAAIAAAPILPHTANKRLSAPKVRFLVFSKTIDAETMKHLGDQYVIKDLTFGEEPSSTGKHFELKDRWGTSVSAISWKPNNLGNLARQSYFSASLAAVALLFAAMLPIAVGLGRTLLKLEKNEQNERIIARTDMLSGLPNRLHFIEFVQKHLEANESKRCALMLMDLDGFKLVNDIFDHATGDKLIRAIAAGLECLVSANCKLARLGGDEFAIAIIAENANQQAIALAENILKFVSEPFDLDGRYAAIGASIGIATTGEDHLQAHELIRRADIAMYKVKENGGSGFLNYEHKFDSKNSQDVVIADELRALLAKQDFDVVYQPLVDAASHDIITLETLARWPQSSPAKYTPDRFITVAEQFGLIDTLSRVIAQKAFRDSAAWPNLRLTINISPLQLNNRHLISDIETAARQNGFALNRLEVEFTEAVLIKNSKRARHIIAELKQRGISVALDDFGSGYASVGYLRKFSFDKIKLDRSLTRLASSNSEALMVVQGAILIAKGLSAIVVAEGVETEEEARIMHLAGCQVLQGYYFHRPQSAAAISAYIASLTTPVEQLMMA